MLINYLHGLFESQTAFGKVIFIELEQIKSVNSLKIEYDIGMEGMDELNVQKVNLDLEFSPASKYDFTNIRSLCLNLSIALYTSFINFYIYLKLLES